MMHNAVRPVYVVIDTKTGKQASEGFYVAKQDAKAERDHLNGGKHGTPDGQRIPALRFTVRSIYPHTGGH